MAMSRSKAGTDLKGVVGCLKAAGEPSRVRILTVLEEGELCACHLVELLGIAQPTVSRHLSILRTAGLVDERKNGRWVHYRLAAGGPFHRRMLRAIRDWGEQDPAVAADRERARTFREVPVTEFCTAVRRRRS
jgi:DNA-binding transcriptional ArsR family regulator